MLIISRCPPYPLYLGDRLILYHLAEQFAARGIPLDLVAFYNQPTDPDDVSHYAHFFRSIKLIREPARSQSSYLFRLLVPARFFPQRDVQAWSRAMWHAISEALPHNVNDPVMLFGGVQVYEYRALLRGLRTVIVPYESYSLYLDRFLSRQRNLV